MKKVLALTLAALMVLSLAACGSKPAAEEAAPAAPAATEAAAEEKAEIPTVTPGKLTVATSPDFAPYEFYAIDENGDPQLAGFDMAMAKYVANELGLELEVVPMDFDGTIMELSQGNVDMSLAGYSVTEERKEIMDFSIVYYSPDQALVTSKDLADKITKLEDANNPEYTVEAQVGSIQADLMHENTPDADCVEMVKVTDIVAEIINGKAQAAFVEKCVAESYAKQYPELTIVCDVPFESEGTAAGISKGNTALVEAVNAALKKMMDSGEFNKAVAEANELASGEVYEGLLDDME